MLKIVFLDVGGVLAESLFSYLSRKISSYYQLNEQLVEHRLTSFFSNVKRKKYRPIKDLIIESAAKSLCEIDDKVELKSVVEELYKLFYEKDAKLFPETQSCLKMLKCLGFLLGVISDAEYGALMKELRLLKLTDFFEIIVSSSMVNTYKPDPLLFKTALKMANCMPEEAIYIGDMEDDLVGSKRVGMFNVLINRGEISLSEKVLAKADYVIEDLNELLPIVRRLKF